MHVHTHGGKTVLDLTVSKWSFIYLLLLCLQVFWWVYE